MNADPQIRDRLERAARFIQVDADRRLDRIHHAVARRERGRRVRALMVAAAVGVAAVVVVSQIRPDRDVPTGAGPITGRIGYLHTQDGRRGLFELDLATGEVAALTDERGSVLYGAWSPEGSRIAYTLEGPGPRSAVVVARADGSEVTTIYEAADTGLPGPDLLDLAWSPDGRRIAFSGRAPGQGRTILIVDADGSGAPLVLDGTWVSVSWSPDGGRLLLTGFPTNEGDFDLYTVRLDGSDPVQLTHDEVTEHEPAWSPDGTQIVFAMGGAYFQDVYLMDADGTDVRRLTHWEGLDMFPAWSPDGDRIAFASDRGATSAQQASNRSGEALFSGLSIYVMRTDGSEASLLPGMENALPMAWTP